MSSHRLPHSSSVRSLLGAVLLPAVAGLMLFSACSDGDEDKPYAPDNCQRTIPETGWIIAEVTLNSQNRAVPVTVYRGDWEAGDEVRRDTTDTADITFELPADTYYSLIARYVRGRDTVLVVDGGKLHVKREEFRDATCWSVPDVSLDLRLQDR